MTNKGFLFAFLTALLWGILPIKLQALLKELDPITTTFYRLFFSSLILFIYFYSKNALPTKSQFNKKTCLLLGSAVFGLTANYILFVQGLQIVNAQSTQILMQISTNLMIVASVFIYKEQISFSQWLGVFLLFLGIILFFNQNLESLLSSMSEQTKGVIIVILASVLWLFYGLSQKSLLKTFNSQVLMLLVFAFSCICVLPFANLTKIFDLSLQGFILLILCSLNTLIAYGSLAFAMKIWESNKVSATLTLTPLITFLTVYLLSFAFPEKFTAAKLNALAFFGMFLVMFGSTLTILGINKLLRLFMK